MPDFDACFAALTAQKIRAGLARAHPTASSLCTPVRAPQSTTPPATPPSPVSHEAQSDEADEHTPPPPPKPSKQPAARSARVRRLDFSAEVAAEPAATANPPEEPALSPDVLRRSAATVQSAYRSWRASTSRASTSSAPAGDVLVVPPADLPPADLPPADLPPALPPAVRERIWAALWDHAEKARLAAFSSSTPPPSAPSSFHVDWPVDNFDFFFSDEFDATLVVGPACDHASSLSLSIADGSREQSPHRGPLPLESAAHAVPPLTPRLRLGELPGSADDIKLPGSSPKRKRGVNGGTA